MLVTYVCLQIIVLCVLRSYNEVLKYFMKSEKADLEGFEMTYHRSRDGEMPVEFVPKK